MKQRALGTYEVAEICHVTPATVGNWINKGLLPTFSTGGGHRRVLDTDLVEFLKKHNIPVSKELENQSKYKILVVDDEANIIDLVTRILKDKYENNIEVYSAMDGFMAGQKVELYKPNLIILDLRLPGIDGFEVCRHIKSSEELKKTRIIAITGNNTPEFREKALKYGADDFMPKPFTPAQLLEKVNGLIEKIV